MRRQRVPDRCLTRSEQTLRAAGFGFGLGLGGLSALVVALIQYVSGHMDAAVFSGLIGGGLGFLIGAGCRIAGDILAGLYGTQERLARIDFAVAGLAARAVRLEKHLGIPGEEEAVKDVTNASA